MTRDEYQASRLRLTEELRQERDKKDDWNSWRFACLVTWGVDVLAWWIFHQGWADQLSWMPIAALGFVAYREYRCKRRMRELESEAVNLQAEYITKGI